MMEYFPAQAQRTKAVITKCLHDADAVILIAGASYGSRADKTRSYVEWELDQAREFGMPVVVLILAPESRARVRNVDANDRQKQEEFIARLEASETIVKYFNAKSFDREFGSALAALPASLRWDAGYIRMLDLHKALAKVDFVRVISGLALVRQSCLQLTTRKTVTMAHPTDARQSMHQTLDILYDEMTDNPVTIEVVSNLVMWFLDRIHGLPTASGFAPQSMEELRLLLEVLFGDTLRTLKATSIHSGRREFVSYQGYWNHPDLGTFFRDKNRQFLTRPTTGHEIQRIYACDGLAESVAEPWFAETVLQQVGEGALVKVVEINGQKLSSYEDFGIYEHEHGPDDRAGYLLLAPVDQNNAGDDLRTIVTPERNTVQAYTRKFDRMWRERDEALTIDHSPFLDEAYSQPLGLYGVDTINSLFEECIILRNMRRLDTGDALLPDDAGFVRKYELNYAEALAKHVRTSWPDTRNILYVGDTYRNDGGAIRNLQNLRLDVSGFICEPRLGLRRLWFNSTLYSNSWTDLIAFAARNFRHVNQNTLAIFDIDQTLWAPKGVHDRPLALTRTEAMARLVEGYVHDAAGEVAERARERIPCLYEEISGVKYHKGLTMDNEDYKAAICVFLSLNLLWDPYEERGDRQRGIEFFNRLGRLPTAEFVSYVRDNYLLPLIASAQGSGLGSMTQLITQAMAAGTTDQYSNYGETHGISVPRVNEDVLSVFRAMTGPSTIKYEAFRLQEFQEAHRRASGDLPLDEAIVINKSAWDLARWLRDRGVKLLGLSDRPDEATALGELSLLNAEMRVYGRPIAHYLEQIASG